jgi:mannose-6-phosphate isomerase
MSGPGAFRLQPVSLPKVWAAPRLEHPLGELVGAPAGTGEVWLASDRHQVTPVAEGRPAGLGLDQVVSRWPGELLGPGREGPFPLLLKLLSVGDWLSVQVHPDDEAARRLEGEPWGKSEAWLVLAARPGAEIVMGLKPGVDRGRVAGALEEGRITDLLARVPAGEGQAFHLPAGTLHATGPGLTIFEVQQASDVTYRFYDWDRPGDDGRPRQLHQDKALEALKPTGPGAASPRRELAPGVELVVEDPRFALLRARPAGPYRPFHAGRRLRAVVVEAGGGRLETEAGGYRLAAGQCWVLPWSLQQAAFHPGDQGLALLEAVAL